MASFTDLKVGNSGAPSGFQWAGVRGVNLYHAFATGAEKSLCGRAKRERINQVPAEGEVPNFDRYKCKNCRVVESMKASAPIGNEAVGEVRDYEH